ncbi:Aste57867_10318 [Aphanomyces stellatus]|uniref:Aste57867_10318 protein n=1 Tax=Aphanomyces stellatus TaxID=120398 RepID=A0A485KQK6_9STRA|nr:hypothetical protein As57867_010278 [Aphanomyces stellatus]VFT87192.1 Aste57867_10318 [Aphanomyces stellatus]
MEIPVKSTFFPPMRLSPREVATYIDKSQRALDQLRDAATSFSWKRIESKDGLVLGKVHCIEQHPKASRVGKSTACLVVRGTATIRATVAEVLQLVGAPETPTYRNCMRRLHGKPFLDAISLASIACVDPSSTCRVKWAAFKDADTCLDYCFLEATGVAVDARTGVTYGYCVLHSLDRPREVPSLAALGFRRDEFRRTGVLVYPSGNNDDTVTVTLLAQGSPDKLSLEKLEGLLTQRIARVLTRLPDFVSMRRLGAIPAVDKSQWIHDTCRKFCAVCLKSFHFARKHHCRLCGEVVCGSCAAPREVDIGALGTSAMVRVCSACVSHAHAVAASVEDAPRPRRRSVSADHMEQLQLAHDAFDVVDRRVLARHESNQEAHRDKDTRKGAPPQRAASLDTADARHPPPILSNLHHASPPKARTVSMYATVPTTALELDALRDRGLSKASFISVDSEANDDDDDDMAIAPVVADTLTAAKMQGVQEIFSRLAQIRATLNQNVLPPPPVSVAGSVSSPPVVPLLLLDGEPRENVVFEDDDDDNDDDDDLHDDHHEDDVDEGGVDVNDLDDDEDDDMHDDDLHDHDAEPRLAKDDMPEDGDDDDDLAAKRRPSITTNQGTDVEDLRSQISELHRLLEAATMQLTAAETQSSSTYRDRALQIVELQSGNNGKDPLVVARRRAHRAVVGELHDIMGL